VVERLDIKQNLMAKLAEVVRPDTIITSNTSGIPIKSIAEGLGDEFTNRFMGTHFFNPPRYLHLLEVIPNENTDPELVAYMQEFGVDGKKEFCVMNLDTFEYEPPKNPTVEIAQKHRKVKNTGERIKLLIQEPDRFGQFLFHLHAFYLAYASHRVPEITDTIVNI